ncbi:hypothetical protein IPV08_00405 [Methylobacterium sp. SD274]|uniref:hypothetical protein n=1 Tax=Methylobacterium sp. SD274 TaxID=2782009 RepID=UPI001A96816F|nr:hypothetical protein [Methylobacterium sp. SD274]MBO1018430.1 hypothetical protein [Methylobacterium sp. SD274]
MTKLSRVSAVILLAALVPLSCISQALAENPHVSTQDSEVATLHSSWRGCLQRHFGLQTVLTSRTFAAESAVKSCRGSEAAYLAALSTSPLLGDEDVSRVRPALIQRAKGWLLQKASVTRPL